MPDILTIVGARLNSSRLPAKHLLELYGKPLISRVFERLSPLPGTKVLATTADEYNHPLVEWAKDNSVDCCAYTGDVDDLMGRIDHVVRVHVMQVRLSKPSVNHRHSERVLSPG